MWVQGWRGIWSAASGMGKKAPWSAALLSWYEGKGAHRASCKEHGLFNSVVPLNVADVVHWAQIP